MSNPNFGVLDIETFDDIEGSKVYALGYTTLLEKSQLKTFYLTDNFTSLDSNLLI
jgi:hypothetical protein